MLLSNLQVGNGCAVALDGETGGNGELEQATEDDEEKDEKDEKDEGEKEEEEEGGSTPAEPGAKASARSEDGEQQLDVADLRSALGSLQTEFTQLSLCPALPGEWRRHACGSGGVGCGGVGVRERERE